MAARFYFAWRMLAAAEAQDNRHLSTAIRARGRKFFSLNDISNNEFRRRYRLTKTLFNELCQELKAKTNLRSSQRVCLEIKVLTALLFFATGSYQRPIGIAKHVSQKMCSVYIKQVCDALTHRNILNKYIEFPNTRAARMAVSQRFYRKYGIPGVIGCIDGSHFKIVVPSREEHLYFSRKHYHSLNVQMVCDDEQRIISVNAKFGGATHDSFIWENSNLNNYMQRLHHNGESVWLLGDSGYPQRPWLMTPMLDAAPDTAEANYNDKHSRARVLIENTFSKLKNRWRCLHKDRTLHYKPNKSAQIILACSVLHNICINNRDLDLHDMAQTLPGSPTSISPTTPIVRVREETTSDLIRGRLLRSQLVQRLNN